MDFQELVTNLDKFISPEGWPHYTLDDPDREDPYYCDVCGHPHGHINTNSRMSQGVCNSCLRRAARKGRAT